MESVLLKANLVNLSTGQYWLNLDGKKGMSDPEGHGHKAVLYKSHFPPLRHSVHQLTERHHCIHRLINHVYYQRTKTLCYSLPHDNYNWTSQKLTIFGCTYPLRNTLLLQLLTRSAISHLVIASICTFARKCRLECSSVVPGMWVLISASY